jgi:hypothetical protein
MSEEPFAKVRWRFRGHQQPPFGMYNVKRTIVVTPVILPLIYVDAGRAEATTVTQGSRTADEHILVLKEEGIMPLAPLRERVYLCIVCRDHSSCTGSSEGYFRHRHKKLETSTPHGQGGISSSSGVMYPSVIPFRAMVVHIAKGR